MLSEGSRYGIVLLLLLSAVTVTIVWPPGRLGSLLISALEGASVLVAIGGRASGRAPRLTLMGVVLLSVVVAALATSSVESGIRDLVNAAVIAVLPAIILVRFRRILYVNLQTVLGAVCTYLVIGIVYASVDAGLGHLSGRPFFAEVSNATSSQYMYFSFVTLSTVGYGDLTPALAAARALAVSEALMGQLYLVTVIALLVSNFGRSRQPRRGGGSAAD